MYRSLLVPLDRSSFAEQALPLALSIAERAKARLNLVEVHTLYAFEDPAAGWARFDPDSDDERKQQEQLYLDATAARMTSVSSVLVTVGVLSGSAANSSTVADSILERAGTDEADLIVMTTHRRRGMSRIEFGSVADNLIRRAQIPVLLVRPCEKPSGITPEPLLDNILILLDGSPLAEHVLEPALDLARLMQARCCLLRVVESGSSAAGRGRSDKVEAEACLERVAARLRAQGIQIQSQVVVGRHVVEAILDASAAQASNLIALATHGRGGLKRMVLGSVADKLIRHAATPQMLVYRPPNRSDDRRAKWNEVWMPNPIIDQISPTTPNGHAACQKP